MQPYYNKKIPELQHIIENGKYFFLTGVSPAKPHSLRFKFQLSGVVGWLLPAAPHACHCEALQGRGNLPVQCCEYL